MTEIHSFYLFSNGSGDFFPKNTLTDFKNKLAKKFEFLPNEKWELGIESFGISCNYGNIKLPKNDNASIVITAKEPATENLKLIMPRNREELESWQMKAFYLEEKLYEAFHLRDFRKEICDHLPDTLTSTSNRLSFRPISGKPYWVIMHPTFRSTFGYDGSIFKVILDVENPSTYLTKTLIAGNVHDVKLCFIMDELYYIFKVDQSLPFLTSDEFNLINRNYPKVIKIQCDVIREQIFNDRFSKDLVVFSPDFENTDSYFYKEIESIDYIPIQNIEIETLHIRLLDENDQNLQLLSGQATVLKMNLKRIPEQRKSFNVRLTSEASHSFPKNNNTEFCVRLPQPISFDSSWKVCVNSINYPSKFTTFLSDEDTRTIAYKSGLTAEERIEDTEHLIKTEFIHLFNPDIEYTVESIAGELKHFLETNNLGTINLDDSNRITFTFNQEGKMAVSYFTAKILGWDSINPEEKVIVFKHSRLLDTDPQLAFKPTLTFDLPINVNYLKPNYIMMYSNIVKNTILGNSFRKILKIVPIKHTPLNFIIKEFRNREFYELENSEISNIDIHLRSHDGRHINFLGGQNVIVNLEFSNYHM